MSTAVERTRQAPDRRGLDLIGGSALEPRDSLRDALGGMDLASDPLVIQAFGELAGPVPSSTGGDPLPDPVREPMERSFGTSFSSVRTHTDGAAGATAFARGEHLHFAPGKFAPDTESGRTVLGHELTHVVQQRAGRVSPTPGAGVGAQGWDLPVNDDPALEAEAHDMGARAARGERVTVAGNTSGLAAATGPAQGWDWPWKKKKAEDKKAEEKPVEAPKPEEQVDAGPNQRQESGGFGVDALKKGVIVGTGASFKVADPIADFAKSGGMRGYGGAIGGNVLAGGGFLAGAMGLEGGYSREKDAQRTGDKAGEELGRSQQKDSAQSMLQTGVGVAQTGVDIATVSGHGTKAVLSNARTAAEMTSAGGNALAVAGAGLGIAGNAITFIQAAYEGGTAIHRWRKLNARSGLIQTERGKTWEDRVRNRAKWKTALQGVKMAAAALGIVAGALALASNPVGWAIGIAAAATLGVMAIGKLIGGLWRKRQQNKADAELKKKGGSGPKPEEARQEIQQEVEGAGAGEAGPDAKGKGGKEKEDPKRQEVKKRADEAAVIVSTNAKVASEMVGAIRLGNKDPKKLADEARGGNATPIQEYSDAGVLADTIGLTEEQVASASGQELIEQKISAVNGL